MPTAPQEYANLSKVTPATFAGGVRRAEASYGYRQLLADLSIAEERANEDYAFQQTQTGREQRLQTKQFSADYSNRGLAESGAYQQDLATLIEAQAAQSAVNTRQNARSLEDIRRMREKGLGQQAKEFALAGAEDLVGEQQASAQKDFYNSIMEQRGLLNQVALPARPSSSSSSNFFNQLNKTNRASTSRGASKTRAIKRAGSVIGRWGWR